MEATYNIDFPANGTSHLVVTLSGRLDVSGGEEFEQDFSSQLGAAERDPNTVLFDLSDLRHCTLQARTILLTIQEQLAAKGCRTAYLATRPRLRGLALWIVHLARDANARVVLNESQAEDWLEASSERVQDAIRRSDEALDKIAKLRKAGRA